LWSFTSRGISGLLWYEPPDTDRKLAETEAEALGAFKPISPFDLNFDASKLLSTFSTYMKWHDYFKASWVQDFTSDSWIMVDNVADIPTKIDQRWMVRWTIYDYVSERLNKVGKGFDTSLREIAQTIMDASAENDKVMMDLTHFCRTLQATGMHPDWVPITAVAETINALADERTLMRTGFINLYERGFLDIKSLEDLLSGFFTASFKVAWFNIKELKWEPEKWINLPVRFLPAERKLLELRSVMDRAELLLRELLSVMWSSVRSFIHLPTKQDMEQYKAIYGRAVEELPKRTEEVLRKYGAGKETIDRTLKIVEKVKEYRAYEISELITSYVDELNSKFYRNAVKEVTGKEMSLTIDKPWIDLYTKVASMLRDVEAIDRSRYYARYFLWRALGRFERGYISFDEMAEWVHNIIATIRETPVAEVLLLETSRVLLEGFIRETKASAILNKLARRVITQDEALKELKELGLSEDIAEALIEARARPYVPQPVTYGVMLDVVPEASEIADRMLEVFAFPDWEREYWRIYFERKPIADELTLLRTRIYTALGLGASADAVLSKLDISNVKADLETQYEANKKLLQSYGITKQEWIMYYVLGQMEHFIRLLRGTRGAYVPSLSTMATLIEYVPAAWGYVGEVFKLRAIPSRWATLWTSYYHARELRDDVNRLLSQYIRLSEITEVPEDIEKYVNDMLSKVGFSAAEISVLQQTIGIGSFIRAFNLVVPTVRGAVGDAMYFYDAGKVIDLVFAIRKLPEVWKNYYLALVRSRKAWRMINRYVTELITSYAYYVIDDAYLSSELDSLKTFGLSDDEKTLIIKTAKLRRKRREMR